MQKNLSKCGIRLVTRNHPIKWRLSARNCDKIRLGVSFVKTKAWLYVGNFCTTVLKDVESNFSILFV